MDGDWEYIEKPLLFCAWIVLIVSAFKYHIFIIFGVIRGNVLSFPWMNNKKDAATKAMAIYNIPKDDLLGIMPNTINRVGSKYVYFFKGF